MLDKIINVQNIKLYILTKDIILFFSLNEWLKIKYWAASVIVILSKLSF